MMASRLPGHAAGSPAWPWPAGGGPMQAAAEAADERRTLLALVAAGLVAGAVIAVAGPNALYLGVALIGCAFIVFDFRVGVVLAILLFPLSRTYWFPHELMGVKGLNPLNLLLVATLVACALRAPAGSALRGIAPPSLLLYVVPLLAGGLVGVGHIDEIVFSPGNFQVEFRDAPGYLMEFVAKPLLLVLFALLVGAAAASAAKPERFLPPMIIAVASVCLLVIGFVAASGASLTELASSDARENLTALGPHANEFGHMFAVAFALLLFTWHGAEQRGLKIALGLAIGLDLTALLVTFSRSSFSAVLVIGLLYALWHRRVRTLAAALVVAALALALAPAAFYDRIGTGFGEGLNAMTAGRVEYLWLPLLPEVLRHPFFGNGLASILWSEPMRAGGGGYVLAVNHPHSAYLEALLDVGFVGFAAICAYLLSVFRAFRRLAASPRVSPTLRGFFLGAAAGLAGLLVADVADNSLMPRTEQVFLWFAIGMMYGLARREASAVPR